MKWRRVHRNLHLLCAAAWLSVSGSAWAAEYHGQVTFGGLPLPGATITATQGTKKIATVSDAGGLYDFPDLADGTWKIEVEMQCFSTVDSEVVVSANMPAGKWELTLLPADQILARSKLTPSLPAAVAALPPAKAHAAANGTGSASAPEPAKPAEESGQANEQTADGLLVNGSSSNAATSKYSLDRAFGNSRSNSRNLYTGGLAVVLDNSATDARPYSLSGLDSPRASYNRVTAVVTLGGPLDIPHLIRHGPNLFVAYHWTRDQNAQTESGLVPTDAERAGDLSGLLNPIGQPVTIFDPVTHLPFPGNVVPVSSEAQALLQLYPQPDIRGNSLYNYQIPVLNSTHQDVLQIRLDKSIGRRDQLVGSFNLESTRSSNENLFGFVDTSDVQGMNAKINWTHRFNQRLFFNTGFQFSRLRTQATPYFASRQNISGEAGITGNDQTPTNWGPPTLNFSGGIAALSDGQSVFNRDRTDGLSESVSIYHGRHNITVGGDFRRQEFNDDFQQNPRGTFTFTGAATQGTAGGATAGGSDLADFLLGVPDTSALAYGNADKYLRQSVYDLYATDDWRARPTLTINAGMRWEYGAPVTELYGRLVNLDILPGFAQVAPVLASDPIGLLTGIHYPSSLIFPDKLGFEPRIGFSWRPIPASTVVVHGGYGIYHDTSVYEAPALQLAQQSPLSTSLSVENSPLCPLTLADGFQPCSSITSNTAAVDPKFRVGYAQVWRLAVQRDLPAALQLSATYLGIKGTRGVQQYLPNTYPIGAATPCLDCPSGFVYQASGADSTRESGQLQLRRRLRSGFTATLLYTFSKSIDDAAYLGGQGQTGSSSAGSGSGGASPSDGGSSQTQSSSQANPSIAQNWLNLHAERSLSSFDQRHLLTLQAQYTSGEGLGGGTLLGGWRGKLLKEWTILTDVVVGSGLPETPVYLAAVPGTGYTGTIRPDRTGAPIGSSQPGVHLNVAAYAAPLAGQWGTARRNSITGPGEFTLDTALARTFRPSTRFYLDARISATNLLNHPVFTGWNTTVNSTQFGQPLAANSMRSLETTLRLRF